MRSAECSSSSRQSGGVQPELARWNLVVNGLRPSLVGAPKSAVGTTSAPLAECGECLSGWAGVGFWSRQEFRAGNAIISPEVVIGDGMFAAEDHIVNHTCHGAHKFLNISRHDDVRCQEENKKKMWPGKPGGSLYICQSGRPLTHPDPDEIR